MTLFSLPEKALHEIIDISSSVAIKIVSMVPEHRCLLATKGGLTYDAAGVVSAFLARAARDEQARRETNAA